MTNPEVLSITAVGVIVPRFYKGEEEILLVTNGPASDYPAGVVSLPGGRPEVYETLERAAVREVREEAGLYIRERRLVRAAADFNQTVERGDGRVIHVHGIGFVATRFEGQIRQENNETKPFWAPIRRLDDAEALLPGLREPLNIALAAL